MEIFGEVARSPGGAFLLPYVWWVLLFAVGTFVASMLVMPRQELILNVGRGLNREKVHMGLLSLSVGAAILVVLLCAAVILQFMVGLHFTSQ